MKLLYLKESLWEFDYIVNEILYTIEKEIELYSKDNFKLLLNRSELIENNILVISTCFNINDVVEVVLYIKPIAIFYLSDEVGNCSDFINLDKYAPLFFRQYNHTSYSYSSNNYQIPLGYAKNFLSGKPSSSIQPKKIKEREFNCSFIGDHKSDRAHMSRIFQENMKNTNIQFVHNNWNIDQLPYSPEKCFDLYNNSIFVVCGRGNVTLDCFRIYEAIVAGAIPVIVGPMEEIKNTFSYNNNIPPCIYEDSWEDAVNTCNNLLNDDDALQSKQQLLLDWWKMCILNITTQITDQIKLD